MPYIFKNVRSGGASYGLNDGMTLVSLLLVASDFIPRGFRGIKFIQTCPLLLCTNALVLFDASIEMVSKVSRLIVYPLFPLQEQWRLL